MNKTTLYLPPDLHQAVKEAARRTRRSQAAVVREALEQYLRTLEQPRLRSLGMGADPGLTGRNSEDWLARHWARSLTRRTRR
ncbi:MAG: ribbon-helix-helix protein, CopG family [Armatimonadetes bacterium]|nr:ribbon-helix-helix protein, CopG family [Armatimonadota bacterium]